MDVMDVEMRIILRVLILSVVMEGELCWLYNVRSDTIK